MMYIYVNKHILNFCENDANIYIPLHNFQFGYSEKYLQRLVTPEESKNDISLLSYDSSTFMERDWGLYNFSAVEIVF